MSPISTVFHTVESVQLPFNSEHQQVSSSVFKMSMLTHRASNPMQGKTYFHSHAFVLQKQLRSLAFNRLLSFIWEQSKYYIGRSNDQQSNLIQQDRRAEIGKVLIISQTFRYKNPYNLPIFCQSLGPVIESCVVLFTSYSCRIGKLFSHFSKSASRTMQQYPYFDPPPMQQ